MSNTKMITVDGNEATASVAHRLSEVIAIYPITPSSNMGEWADEWSAQGRKNIWGTVPQVTEMQSEGGAAGAVHGALQAGALTTTFTASQGLLLMIPNMFKIAGELTSFAMHVSARTLATHALSIFGDHSDVMSCRGTGFAMLSSASVQEAHDFALISHASTLKARVPFLHFFDGFRTSHEVAKICELTDEDLHAMVDDEMVATHRARRMTPDNPIMRGTAQNPDTFFQAREAGNKFYDACPAIVQEQMDRFAALTGRKYGLVEYFGAPDAERVIVLMGSGCDVTHEYVEWALARGEKVGVVKVRLYRPFPVDAFVAALPKTVRAIAVMDRTKEPGANGEPLFLDVIGALHMVRAAGKCPLACEPTVIGGRYGLSSKEFTPAMVRAIYEELGRKAPRPLFTVGIHDDVTQLSLDYDKDFDIEPDDVSRSVFFGLGSDGTVGANKNSIKIIAHDTDNYGQGYFVYDSKKAGAITTSHLRFGPRQIRSAYLIRKANFVACHQYSFLEKYDMLRYAAKGAVFLLNAPYSASEVWQHLPCEVQKDIIAKQLRFYVIDAYKVARENDMGVRINTIMQTCFFAISGVLPRDEAIKAIKKAIEKTYGKKGQAVVEKNFAAVDNSVANLHQVNVPEIATSCILRPPAVHPKAPQFVKDVTAAMMSNNGEDLPVSAFPVDGTWPTGTTKWEKRNIALDIPVWDPSLCIQCAKCSIICPHAAIRAKVYEGDLLKDAPATFKSVDYKAPDFKGKKWTIQIAPEDCTGCGLCAKVCPGRNKAVEGQKALMMQPQLPLREAEAANFEFFLGIPNVDRALLKSGTVKGSQLMEPLFEFSGACAGCGETPYVKLLSQLFGDRALVANATGCSSIYGGNLPTTPYTVNCDGRGPTWNNSLFEDNAEFGLGFRLAVDKHREQAVELLQALSGQIGDELVAALIEGADKTDDAQIAEQRVRVADLRARLAGIKTSEAGRLLNLSDYLVHKSVWILGGDGWAYDIGYGGLDHVLAQGRNVNILVLDTEVYSNTGGQASKATPLGASAKFAMAGKSTAKKDLAMIAMTYGNVYVAKVSMGAKDAQVVKAFKEAESYPGTSLIIAYSHCIAHGYDLINGPEHQATAVATGIWPLFRWDPRRLGEGLSPLQLDSGAPAGDIMDFVSNETRFRMVQRANPERFEQLMKAARKEVATRFATYEQISRMDFATMKEEPKD
ncbi:pyruvate:ferredoxin (flavodoxin) oxidoreductase [Myxococcota bacterium]|nr:pyruvate:ferredoxin (flavodoxin) oxidoreductase [Myxococcota bacterium]